ncbi:hypothetical protein M673_19950 (plasmid) [Aureimonas sp. AU20]|nr:hypothetical protein M673_19950 [Aureimonas sp. AU20]
MACCILAGLAFGAALSLARAIRRLFGTRTDPLNWRPDR